MSSADVTGPTLMELIPFQNLEGVSQKFVRLARFHGSQKLNLMRTTRMPANSRKYNFGDPVHLIDWRAFARTEQLTVKEQYDEASSAITVILQNSPSMLWPEENIVDELDKRCSSKLEIACRIACHLTLQALRSGDRVRLLWHEEDLFYQIPLSTQVDVSIFFEKLKALNFSGVKTLLGKSAGSAGFERSDFLYWINDGLDGLPFWVDKISSKYACWIHTMSSLELSATWLNTEHCFFDDGFERKEYMGYQLKITPSFEDEVKGWQKKIQAQWLSHCRGYFLVTEDTLIKNYLNSLQRVWDFADGPLLGERV